MFANDLLCICNWRCWKYDSLNAEASRQSTAAVVQTVAVATLLTKNWYSCRQLRALAHPLSLG